MGGSASRPAESALRKFPSRAPGSVPPRPSAAAARRAPPPAATSQPAPTTSVQQQQQQQQRPAPPQASFTKNEAILADSQNPNNSIPELTPAFAERLKQMGIAQPSPTFSPSSIASVDASGIGQSISGPRFPASSNNATLGALEARKNIQAQAEAELENMGRSTDKGREYVDVYTIKQILLMREKGETAKAIEDRLRLRPGVVNKLGGKGILHSTSLGPPSQ
ncbi:hypothetical protein QBC35DRAFT_425385 [Podospora australis]|uniref:Helix-turn-helix domain-containing protein n=1 Tax=Podospora australis TaxID=1536484 RepID=A0AAN6X2N4_9PEZI|nr:hypothetical protein QBC35DRAFT_425385 [Podospora australis]